MLDHNLPWSEDNQNLYAHQSAFWQIKFSMNLCDIPLEASNHQNSTDSDRFRQWLRWHWTCRSQIQKRHCHPEIGEQLGRSRGSRVKTLFFARTNAGCVSLYTTLSKKCIFDDLLSFYGIVGFSGSLKQSLPCVQCLSVIQMECCSRPVRRMVMTWSNFPNMYRPVNVPWVCPRIRVALTPGGLWVASGFHNDHVERMAGDYFFGTGVSDANEERCNLAAPDDFAHPWWK